MNNISYSAVVLDEKSRQRLIERFKSIIPQDFEIIAHHMTINMGEIQPELQQFLGFPVRLSVNSIGSSDKAIAVGVSGFESQNETPHITLAVNRKAGGKPMMSNYITDWKPLKHPLYLTGKVTEVKYR